MAEPAPAPPRMPEPGDVVAERYRIERILGEGGMGRVFEAHHLVLDQRVALKVLFAEVASRPNVVERFLREAKLTARLRSEHVALVMDAGTSETGLPFLVMECLQGTDLMDLVRKGGRLPWRMVVDVVMQALAAVSHAHAAGIVHRDLKPSNLFLATMADGSTLVKVLDFGIFKSLGDQGEEVKTLTGQTLMGSPAYMAPEQIRDAKGVDARSDLWSLGVVMHELITAELPFRGQGVGELLAAVLEQDPPPLRSRVPDVPEEIEKAVLKALRRHREYRYASAAEFAQDLAPFVSPKWAPLVGRIEEALRNSAFVPTPSAVTPLERSGPIPGLPPPLPVVPPAPAAAPPEETTPAFSVHPLKVATPSAAAAGATAKASPSPATMRQRLAVPRRIVLAAGTAALVLLGFSTALGLRYLAARAATSAAAAAPPLEAPRIVAQAPAQPPAPETTEPTTEAPAPEPGTPAPARTGASARPPVRGSTAPSARPKLLRSRE